MRAPIALSAAALAIASFSAPPANAAGYPIYGKILQEYNEASQANGKSTADFFGDAITAEANDQAGGRFQKFYRNSSIYWNPNVSNGHANQIGGDIRARWVNDYNYEIGPLKYPTTRELSGRKTGVRFNRFQGGNMYYSPNPNVGTHPVWGGILNTWGANNYEAGKYGMPTSDEYNCSGSVSSDTTNGELYGGWGQNFEGGWITFGTTSFTNKNNSAVSGKTLGFLIQSPAGKYYSEVDHAKDVWGALGSVNIVSLYEDPEKDASLNISAVDRDDVTWAGRYDRGTGFAGLITLNEAYLDSYGNTGRESVVAHEFGHALGLAHSCEGQLMDPYASRLALDITSPQFMDVKAYRDMWG